MLAEMDEEFGVADLISEVVQEDRNKVSRVKKQNSPHWMNLVMVVTTKNSYVCAGPMRTVDFLEPAC